MIMKDTEKLLEYHKESWIRMEEYYDLSALCQKFQQHKKQGMERWYDISCLDSGKRCSMIQFYLMRFLINENRITEI